MRSTYIYYLVLTLLIKETNRNIIELMNPNSQFFGASNRNSYGYNDQSAYRSSGINKTVQLTKNINENQTSIASRVTQANRV